VHARRRGTTNEQRNLAAHAPHLPSNMNHLVQRRCNETRQAHNVDVVVDGGLSNKQARVVTTLTATGRAASRLRARLTFRMVSQGTMTPRSMILKLLQPRTTPTMFLPMSCTSPFTVASNTWTHTYTHIHTPVVGSRVAITSHHITSHHITSHHITSHHITSHHITSHPIPSHPITSHMYAAAPTPAT
jgi:hypothetical protein